MAEDIIVPVSMFLAIFGILYVFFTTRNKERLALIEKGADPGILSSKHSFKKTTLKYGMFFMGIGLGILMGNILESYAGLKEEVAYFSMIFLFGGLSLVLHHMVASKDNAAG